ncbi:MAG: patatin-like phospholipase family protein [Proteobacteria bacterium]|nr:patatin-like phospholipase family protein [Pseudomonadota bacterium]
MSDEKQKELEHLAKAVAPTTPISEDDRKKLPRNEIGLCLSGGGYRAMLFHLGTLWRLAEIGWLDRIARISTVSGGTIPAAYLALQWQKFGNATMDGKAFAKHVVPGIRRLAGDTIDAESVIWGILSSDTIAEKVAKAYDKHLFEGATLADIRDQPRFVFNATNVQSGVLWRFSKPYMADYRVGMVKNPKVALATAVAASSAFPPVLSPAELELDPATFAPDVGGDLAKNAFRKRVVLSDGGVYDNLGLETVWKSHATVLVSDAGAKYEPEEKPAHDWARHSYRVLNLIDSQVRALRKQQVIGAYVMRKWMMESLNLPADNNIVRHVGREGAYWSIASSLADYHLPDAPLPCPADRTRELAAVPTRLKALDDSMQNRLINWGYAICDAAMRKHVDASLGTPKFPCEGGV